MTPEQAIQQLRRKPRAYQEAWLILSNGELIQERNFAGKREWAEYKDLGAKHRITATLSKQKSKRVVTWKHQTIEQWYIQLYKDFLDTSWKLSARIITDHNAAVKAWETRRKQGWKHPATGRKAGPPKSELIQYYD